jgi:HSP20 family molecular chaperone IbpA
LLREAGQIQRRFFQLGAADAPAWEPAVDLFETREGLSVEVALPGVVTDALEVSLESGSVVVRGERAFPAEQQRVVIYRLEIPYGRFERRIPLPTGRYQLADRRLENGCLVLALRRLG